MHATVDPEYRSSSPDLYMHPARNILEDPGVQSLEADLHSIPDSVGRDWEKMVELAERVGIDELVMVALVVDDVLHGRMPVADP